MLDNLIEDRVDHKKSGYEGITYFIDIVKIYGAYPLLVSEDRLSKRIDFYHDNNVLVSTGSSLTEYALRENVFNKFIEESKIAGFDIIEISENNIHLSFDEKKKIAKIIKSHGLKHHWKIGKKDPRRQLTFEETIK